MRKSILFISTLLIAANLYAQEFECDSVGIEAPLNFNTTVIPQEICPNTNFCISFEATNFDSVQGFIYTLTFDPSKMIFVSVTEQDNPLRGDFAFTTEDTNLGQIEVLWSDPNMLGQSIPDGIVLYELCFITIAEPLDSLSLFINNDIEPAYPDAGVLYQPAPQVACTADIITINEVDQGIAFEVCCENLSIIDLNTCLDSGSGIALSACGGVAPYAVSITNNDNNQVIDSIINTDGELLEFFNLNPGNYSIDVLDSNNENVNQIVQLESYEPITYDVDITQPTCSFRSDGGILFSNLSGGSGTYTIRAQNGLIITQQPEYNFSNLDNGTYTFLIEDTNGCFEEEVVVLDTPELEYEISIDPPTCSSFDDGFLEVTVVGGTPFPNGGYSFNGTIQTTYEVEGPLFHPDFDPQTRLFSVIIEDANGCIVGESFEIPLLFAPGDPCDDNDPATVNDQIQNDCTCRGELITGVAFIGDTETFLPPDMTISLANCLGGYTFPNGIFTNPEDGTQYIFPLVDGFHFIGQGSATFNPSHLPIDTFPAGTTTVFYTVFDSAGNFIEHDFDITIECELECSSSLSCNSCETVLSCAYECNLLDLVNGFTFCSPDWDGNSVQSNQPNPLCATNSTPQNMSWYAFTAGSETLDVRVTVINCIGGQGGNIGIEAGVYDNCESSTCIAFDQQCGSFDALTLNLRNLTPGEIYYLFVDGCDGATCEYAFEIANPTDFTISGVEEIVITAPTGCAISGSAFCQDCTLEVGVRHNGSAVYEEAGLFTTDADLDFHWFINDPVNGRMDFVINPSEDGYLFPPLDVSIGPTFGLCLQQITAECAEWNGIRCAEITFEDCGVVDRDGDGFSFEEDCDDDDPISFPGATEICDGVDNNCDGDIDEGLTTTYYADNDMDGFGDPNSPVELCEEEEGFVTNNEDCNDNSTISFPGAMEICDGLDNNCDGEVDEGFMTETYYADEDFDGFGDPNNFFTGCVRPFGFVDNSDDCDDTDNDINPNALEDCDGIDNNCDGVIDEGFTLITYYADMDQDGFGDPNTSTESCVQPPDTVEDNTDCDDTDPNVYPGAPEILGNNIDENCDGRDNTTSINEIDGPSYILHPNPTSDRIYVSNVKYTHAMIYDRLGQLVKLETSGKGYLQLRDLESGIYFIKLFDHKDQIGLSRILKQ